jgi:hypothetical protein
MGAQTKAHVRTARRLPNTKPMMTSKAPKPKETKSAPITNSVPATCSPAYDAAKYFPDCRDSGATGVLSNSLTTFPLIAFFGLFGLLLPQMSKDAIK